MDKIEKLESELKKILTKNDLYLVRKYCNREQYYVVREVAERNHEHRLLIYDLFAAWHDELIKCN